MYTSRRKLEHRRTNEAQRTLFSDPNLQLHRPLQLNHQYRHRCPLRRPPHPSGTQATSQQKNQNLPDRRPLARVHRLRRRNPQSAPTGQTLRHARPRVRELVQHLVHAGALLRNPSRQPAYPQAALLRRSRRHPQPSRLSQPFTQHQW